MPCNPSASQNTLMDSPTITSTIAPSNTAPIEGHPSLHQIRHLGHHASRHSRSACSAPGLAWQWLKNASTAHSTQVNALAYVAPSQRSAGLALTTCPTSKPTPPAWPSASSWELNRAIPPQNNAASKLVLEWIEEFQILIDQTTATLKALLSENQTTDLKKRSDRYLQVSALPALTRRN